MRREPSQAEDSDLIGHGYIRGGRRRGEGKKRDRSIKKELRFLQYDLIVSDPPTPVFLSITHRKFSTELSPLSASVCVSLRPYNER